MNRRAKATVEYPHLLSRLDGGRLRLKNRVVFPGHQTLFSEGGIVGDRMLAYYLDRARGGVGAVIVEGAAVHPSTIKFPNYLLAYDPEIVPSLDRLADALHEHDCRVILQLAHSGSRMSTQDSRQPLWAPSDVRSANSPEVPHAVTRADIADLLDGYEASARHVVASRVDGIEIHAAHEYLLSAFFSPLSNRRDDEYGGSLENRCRLAVEVAQRIRRVVGDDLVVGIRLNGSDLVEGGLESDDCVAVARHVTANADLDYVHVSAGRSSHNQAIVPPMDVPQGVYADLAAAVRNAVYVPVIAVGRIKTPELAEQILADGKADAVAVARALIAEPQWVHKAASARNELRPCIGCNQGCYGNLALVRPISCTVNPAVGRERELGIGTETAAAVARRVVVVGGGPAGMEAALTAAGWGHEVVLLEASERLGGQVRLGAGVEARRELADIVDFQERQLERLKVDVRLGVRADAATLADLGADVVVAAVGSTPRPLDLPNDGSVPVRSPHDALDGLGGPASVVVLDDVGHFPAYVPAEALRDAGAEVTLVSSRFAPGWALDPTTAETMIRRLAGKGVRFVLHSAPLRIADGALWVRDVLSGAEQPLPATTLVAAAGNVATEDHLTGPEVHRIGDCVAPRTVLEAIRDGREVGRRL